jgi:hypothetical protein
MKPVIEMSEKEQVICGLHASKPGRLMYQSVGFDHVSDFIFTLPGDEGGGVMIYTPNSLKQKNQSLDVATVLRLLTVGNVMPSHLPQSTTNSSEEEGVSKTPFNQWH